MVGDRLPLSALLSRVLVAFTVEFDNEFEHRLPHGTTNFGVASDGRRGPWLTSAAMYFNCMKHVPGEGILVRDLYRLARTQTNLAGMLRWGYLRTADKPNVNAWVVPKPGGLLAKKVWAETLPEIESRWRARFGESEVGSLSAALEAVVEQIPFDVPECLPILKYGLWGGEKYGPKEHGLQSEALPILLSRALLVYSLDYEAQSDVALAIGANVLRLVEANGVRPRELPTLSGVSKEAIAMATGFLVRSGYASTDAVAPRGQLFKLKEKGAAARAQYFQLTHQIDERWAARYGAETTLLLRNSLERLVGSGNLADSPLVAALKPYPDGWRAKVRAPAVLPDYPMVLHRGGYPDGS